MKELRESVRVLAVEELKRANDQFPLFNSDHEALGVILEEVLEARFEANAMIGEFKQFEQAICNDMDKGAIDVIALNLRKHAIELACEAIQVAAMAVKYRTSKDERELPRFVYLTTDSDTGRK